MPALQPGSAPMDPTASISLAAKVVDLREQGKKKYEESGEALALLAPMMKVGQVIKLPDGRYFKFVDNFAETNLVYRPAAVSQFELTPLSKKEAAELA